MQKAVSIKPLSESRAWKVLEPKIDAALKDPEFVKFLRDFSKQHSR